MNKIQQVIEGNEKFFEANYLDGDKIQDGQMLSSKQCLDAIESSQLRLIEAFKEMIEGKHRKLLGSVEENDIWRTGYNKALDDLLSELEKVVKENKER
jgi:hypothetical protein